MKTYPPFLDQIHEHCPKAASIYTRFWREKGSDNIVYYPKEKITEEYYLSWKSFKHNLKLLRKEGVIKFSLNSYDDKVTITLIENISQSAEKVA